MDMTLPLPQSPEFARAAALLGRPVTVHEDAGLRWQMQTRALGPFGQVRLISRGPVADRPADLDQWVRARGREGPLLLNAEGIAPECLTAAGFWPVMTPATLAMLDLRAEASMRSALGQKWRNRLNRSEAAGLGLSLRDLSGDDWLLRAEATQAAARRYRGMPQGFCLAFAAANPGKALVFEARHGGSPVAAALVLLHGRMATWQIGVSLPEGRRLNAMNRLLWTAMTHLAARGTRVLDLGILNNEDAKGLAHFKLGTGARAVRLSGTWLSLPGFGPVARRLPTWLRR